MRFGAVLTAGVAVTLASWSGALPAAAQDDGDAWEPWERWSFAAGGFVADLDNTIRIGVPGVGVEIDVEDALGLDRTQIVYRLDGAYRFGRTRRHRLDVTWFDLSRDATRVLEQEIEIDGVIYPVGTTVRSEYDLQFLNARYSYSLYQDDRVDLAGSLGLHITDVGLVVDEPARGRRGDGWTAPLPLIGARLDVAITPNWYMRSHAAGLWIKTGDFEGRIADLLFAGEYRGWEKFAIGAGVNSVRLFVESSDFGGFNGRIESNFVGLMLYGKALF
ncbi:MAG: hypothetical protein JSU82_05565 [Rhodospirillales bacterium]|nr:MAG: hypothetical protein JSU82_05565 [Rhodospirillales bacterium]